jgi:metal-responsive CopG/Arc/MetJ family transcriptional regulator
MPDELLAEVDAEARRLGTSRSAVLRGYAEAALQRRRAARAEAIAALIDEYAENHGGESAEKVKESRPQP